MVKDAFQMVKIRKSDFSIDEVVARMRSPGVGAIITYCGTVRQFPGGAGLDFADRQEALQELKEIEKRAVEEFDIADVAIIHRVGFLGITENILLVAVSAARREAAFNAVSSIINEIKGLHKSWRREVQK